MESDFLTLLCIFSRSRLSSTILSVVADDSLLSTFVKSGRCRGVDYYVLGVGWHRIVSNK